MPELPTSRSSKVLLGFWLSMAIGIVGTVTISRFVFHPLPSLAPPGWTTFRPPHDVHALVIDDHTVWAGGKEGLWAIDPITSNVQPVLRADGRPFPMVHSLALDPATHELYVGHDEGLTSLPTGRSLLDGEASRVQALLFDHGGRLWVGGWNRLDVERDADHFETLPVEERLDPMVNVLFEDSRGGIWLGSYMTPSGGLTILNPGRTQRFTVDQGLPHPSINAIAALSDTEVWVATGFLDRGGVQVFRADETGWTPTRTILKTDGLAGEKARSLFLARDGTVFVGSEYDGLAYLKNGSWHVLTTQDGLCQDEIKAIAQDEAGDLWLGTLDGVSRLGAQLLAALP